MLHIACAALHPCTDFRAQIHEVKFAAHMQCFHSATPLCCMRQRCQWSAPLLSTNQGTSSVRISCILHHAWLLSQHQLSLHTVCWIFTVYNLFETNRCPKHAFMNEPFLYATVMMMPLNWLCVVHVFKDIMNFRCNKEELATCLLPWWIYSRVNLQ